MSRKRLENYVDPYKPKPDILLCDPSIDIHSSLDFELAIKQK
jgi:hypothetical protein